MAVATVVALAASHPGPGAVPNRAAVALALYGASDPDRIEARGLHGLGGTSAPVTVRDAGHCRFVLGSAGQTETVDFARVLAIRVTTIADPVAGLVALVGRAPVQARRLTLMVFDGDDRAFCTPDGCVVRRAFALAEAARHEAAEAAAAGIVGECGGAH